MEIISIRHIATWIYGSENMAIIYPAHLLHVI